MSNEHDDLAAVDALDFDYSEVEREDPIPPRRRGPSGMLIGLLICVGAWVVVIVAATAAWNMISHITQVIS
jgi:hypothetical protein